MWEPGLPGSHRVLQGCNYMPSQCGSAREINGR